MDREWCSGSGKLVIGTVELLIKEKEKREKSVPSLKKNLYLGVNVFLRVVH